MPVEYTRRKWTRLELDYLEIFYLAQVPHKDIAQCFQRTLTGVRGKLRYWGLTKPERQGEARQKDRRRNDEIDQRLRLYIGQGLVMRQMQVELAKVGLDFHVSGIHRRVRALPDYYQRMYDRNLSRHRAEQLREKHRRKREEKSA